MYHSEKVRVGEHQPTFLCVCMHAFMHVLQGKGSRVVASRALAVVQTALHLTSYSDCLTSFHEPLSPSYRHHSGLKNVKCDHCIQKACLSLCLIHFCPHLLPWTNISNKEQLLKTKQNIFSQRKQSVVHSTPSSPTRTIYGNPDWTTVKRESMTRGGNVYP